VEYGCSDSHGVLIASEPAYLLLPKGFEYPEGIHEGLSTFDVDEWDKMEANGAVLLPGAGYREESVKHGEGHVGYYWLQDADGETDGRCISFDENEMQTTSMARHFGCSVRLVRDVE
jgi:hypothetical protein